MSGRVWAAFTAALAIAWLLGVGAHARWAEHEAERVAATWAESLAGHAWDTAYDACEAELSRLVALRLYTRVQVIDDTEGEVASDEGLPRSAGVLRSLGLVRVLGTEQPMTWRGVTFGRVRFEREDSTRLVYAGWALVLVMFSALLRFILLSAHRRNLLTQLQLGQERSGRLEAMARADERERQLREARRLESLGHLAGGIAHDFNNLLTVIIGAADLLQLETESEESRLELRTLLDAAERAADMTRQLLAFGRREPGEANAVSLHDVVRSMGSMLEPLVGEGVRLQTELSPQPAVVLADPARLEQVVLNLVVNARDALGESGTIVVRSLVELDGARAVLEVEDDGIGMDEETRARIFEPFFTTKPEGAGTGLGLATVWGAVKQSGGFVEVRSAPGEGTCFRLTWPQAEPGETSVHDVELLRAVVLPPGTRVLLAEDQALVRQTAASILERAGAEVVAVGSAPAAHEAAAKGHFTVVVVDVHLHGHDGRELVRVLSREQPNLGVVMISGAAQVEITQERAVFLPKPFSAAALQQAVRDVLPA